MNKLNILTTTATLVALLVSCKNKEEAVAPNKKPAATLQVDSKAAKLWNEVKVSVNATDADGTIATVDLYANNELIGSDTKSPYEFSWNTKDFKDGDVTLRAVVTDQMDAVTESVKQVEVMNTLIDYDLYEGFLSMNPNFKFFTYITGKNKEVLYFKQIESLPFKAKVLRPDNFNEEHFDVHIVFANPLGATLSSYTEFTPGKFAPINPDKRGKKIGQSSMKFTNIPQHDYFIYSGYNGKTLKNGPKYTSNVYENQHVGYLYLRQGKKGLYKIIKNLKDGNTQTSLSSMGFEMQKQEMSITGPLDGFNFYVRGHTSSDVDGPAVRLFTDSKTGAMQNYKVQYHTPDKATVFDHYSNFLSVTSKKKTYSTESYFSIIKKPVKLKLNIEFGSHKLSEIKFKASGDPYDVLISKYELTNNGFNFRWACYSKDENLEFPIIPTQLAKAFPKFNNANVAFTNAGAYVSVQDYDHLKGYDSYLSAFAGRTGRTLKDGGKYNAIASEVFIP